MSNINLDDIKIDLNNQILMTVDRSQRDPDNTIVTKVLFEVHPDRLEKFNQMKLHKSFKKMLETCITNVISDMRKNNETKVTIPIISHEVPKSIPEQLFYLDKKQFQKIASL